MKKIPVSISCLVLTVLTATSQGIQSYQLDDSVKVVQFYAEVNTKNFAGKSGYSGIQTDVVKLLLESEKGKPDGISFKFPDNAKVVASGLGTEIEKDEIEWDFEWSTSDWYRLLISTVGDSAGNFSLYSGYLWLPKQEKWKLIGTCRIDGRWSTIKQPATVLSEGRKRTVQAEWGPVWLQRSNGSWKNIGLLKAVAPVTLVATHVDSVQQAALEKERIENDINSGKTDTRQSTEGVYYSIMNPGSGQQVTIEDTVTVHYKGYLYADGTVFDQTRETPARFPLKRLIRGWQLVIPLVKVGGKVKIVIPSGMAYSIRTRAARIPPNSILVFEVEVVETKAPKSP